MPVTTSFFKNFCFNLRTSCKELIWCNNYPNVHVCTFCKCWRFIWRCAFPVSILKSTKHCPILNTKTKFWYITVQKWFQKIVLPSYPLDINITIIISIIIIFKILQIRPKFKLNQSQIKWPKEGFNYQPLTCNTLN